MQLLWKPETTHLHGQICVQGKDSPSVSHVNQKHSALLAMNSKLFSVIISSKPLYSQHEELSSALQRLKGPQLHHCSPMHSLTAAPEQPEIVHADTVIQKHQLEKPFLRMDSRGAGASEDL